MYARGCANCRYPQIYEESLRTMRPRRCYSRSIPPFRCLAQKQYGNVISATAKSFAIERTGTMVMDREPRMRRVVRHPTVANAQDF